MKDYIAEKLIQKINVLKTLSNQSDTDFSTYKSELTGEVVTYYQVPQYEIGVPQLLRDINDIADRHASFKVNNIMEDRKEFLSSFVVGEWHQPIEGTNREKVERLYRDGYVSMDYAIRH